MMPGYVPRCPACQINDPRSFYVGCSGCQARKRALQPTPAPQAFKQEHLDAMDSTMQPLEGEKK